MRLTRAHHPAAEIRRPSGTFNESMPRYFLDFTDTGELLRDNEGMELVDLPVCGPAYADLDTRRGVPAHQLRGPAEMPDVRVAAHPPLGMTDVFVATIPDLPFVPQVHVNYAETVLPMRDGLTKLSDFPKEFGRSGESVPE